MAGCPGLIRCHVRVQALLIDMAAACVPAVPNV
jgi:hypothetical protein